MKVILSVGAVLGVAIAFGAYVRMAPVNPAQWHVDPLTAEAPGGAGWLVRPEGGDAPWPVFDAPPQAVLGALNDIALATARTRAIAGNVEAGRITYMTRSRLWGFPDFTTVEVIPAEGGATLAVLARLRFGASDVGVNRARVEQWEQALRRVLPARSGG